MQDTADKKRKEIIITKNTAISFGSYEDECNGDICIIGNFSGICGDVVELPEKQGWQIADDFYGMDESVFIGNMSVLLNTIRNNHKIVLIASKDTITYFKHLLYGAANLFFSDMSKKKISKLFNYRVYTIDTTDLYEKTYIEYNSNSEYRRNIAKQGIDSMVTNKVFKKIEHMKFKKIIQNPPYNKHLHLDFFEKGLELLDTDGKMVIIEPATWLINVRKNGKAKMYDQIKRKIEGHVESVVIENLNKEFDTNNFVPFSVTTIDFSKTFESIDFVCCGIHKTVNSIYDCNLIGDYDTIQCIINKVGKYGDFMKDHITKKDMGTGVWYAKYSELDAMPICQIETNRIGRSFESSKNLFQEHKIGVFLTKYSSVGYHYYMNEISDTPLCSYDRGKHLTDKIADNVYGTREELENWKHFIFNNKLPLFLNIVMTIDQHNNSKPYLPWLVDRQYTDEEISEMFGFTDEENALIDSTIRKYERNSPWFRRYMCGKGSVSDEDINDFLKSM